MSKPGLLTLTIKDKSALYLAYMPLQPVTRPCLEKFSVAGQHQVHTVAWLF